MKMHVCLSVCICICMHPCVHACVRACVYVCARGRVCVPLQVDIFSYAMFIFELLSGARPFGEMDNPTDINRAIVNHQRPLVCLRYR